MNLKIVDFAKLSNPVPFTVSNLVKLSPATKPESILICVYKFKKDLKVWSLINLGSQWINFINMLSPRSDTPPNIWAFSSIMPGKIAVTVGGRERLVLENGKISENLPILVSGIIAKQFSISSNIVEEKASGKSLKFSGKLKNPPLFRARDRFDFVIDFNYGPLRVDVISDLTFQRNLAEKAL